MPYVSLIWPLEVASRTERTKASFNLTLGPIISPLTTTGRRLSSEILSFVTFAVCVSSLKSLDSNQSRSCLIFSRQSVMVLADRVGLIYLLQGSLRFVESKKSLAADRN